MSRFQGLFSVCALVLGSATAVSSSPSVGYIAPRGWQRGQEITVTFNGANLADTQEVFVYEPGISVSKLEVVNTNLVKVTLKIAADCRLGEHGFRLRTASGISDFRTFWVSALPVIDEIEKNNLFDTPQPIALNVTVHGVVRSEQVDYYQVECKKGQRLSVEVEGQRHGHTFFDPYVAIIDSKRFELVSSDDNPILGQDGGCSVVIPADGKYWVQVRETAFQGNDGCLYRLHVGTFPMPKAVFPAGGKPGEETEFRFVGDPLGEVKQKIKLPAAGPDGFVRIHMQTPDGIHPAGMKIRGNALPGVSDTPAAFEPKGATVGTAPGAFHGVISKADETKYFRFPAKKGQVFDFAVFARKIGSPLDPVLHISLANGPNLANYVIGNDDSAGPDSALRFTAPQDGDYFAWIHDHLRKGGPDYFFRIEANAILQETVTTIPKVDGNNVSNQDRQTVSVPRGNRYAMLANVRRKDWGGPAVLNFDKLPAGVTPVHVGVDPAVDMLPVVFEAKADAPLAGTLSDAIVTHADPNIKFPGRTLIDVRYNISLNNTPFHHRDTNRIAVAVTEAVPFAIEVVQPKVPVVQNGSYNLKIKARRTEPFKGAITIYPLWTPPGMGIAGSATIPEGQTETAIFVNAAPNAPVKSWKTALIAVSDYGKGAQWVSSQLFTLEVAPPFVQFAQERAAVEQGNKTQVVCKVTVATPFEGKAAVNLMGLPAKVTTSPLSLTKDAKELIFDVATDKTSPAGKHGVFCQVIVEKDGEQIVHNVGGGELRIDVPLPPKTTAAAPPAAAKPATPAPAKPAEKRLSRLEQLRQEQEAKEKGEKPK
jgi:hypothetical protein